MERKKCGIEICYDCPYFYTPARDAYSYQRCEVFHSADRIVDLSKLSRDCPLNAKRDHAKPQDH